MFLPTINRAGKTVYFVNCLMHEKLCGQTFSEFKNVNAKKSFKDSTNKIVQRTFSWTKQKIEQNFFSFFTWSSFLIGPKNTLWY